MSRPAVSLAFTVIGLASAGCPKAELGIHGSISYPDFQTFPTPRTFDGPGTVFRIDKKKARYHVLKLTVPVDEGSEEAGSVVQTGRWRFGVALGFLTGARVSAGREHEIVTTLSGGKRQITYDPDIENALRSATIDFKQDNRYFLIRETVAYSAIRHRFVSGWDLSANEESTLRQLMDRMKDLKWADPCGEAPPRQQEASPAPSPAAAPRPSGESPDRASPKPPARVEVSGASARCVDRTFDQPHRVFFLAEELVPAKGALSSAAARFRVNEPLSWLSEVPGPR